MMSFWRATVVATVAGLLVASCGGKEASKKEPAKAEESASKGEPAKAESKTAAKAESKAAPAPAPSAAATPAAPPATPMMAETALPPPETAPAKPEDRIMDPERGKFADYVIKTKGGGEFTVPWFEKYKGKVIFQRGGGEISIPVEDILSIEGRQEDTMPEASGR